MICARFSVVLILAATACGGVAIRSGVGDDGGVNTGGGWPANVGGPSGGSAPAMNVGGAVGGGVGGAGGGGAAGSAPTVLPSPNTGACSILGSWRTHSQPWNDLSTDAVITFYQDGTLSGVPEFTGRWSLVGTAFTIIETSGPDMNCDQEDHWTLTFSPDCRTAPLVPIGSGCTGARRYLDWDVTLTRVDDVGGAAGGSGGEGGISPDVLMPPDVAIEPCVGWCTCPPGDYGIELSVNDGPTVVLRAGTTGGWAKESGLYGGCFEPIAFVGADRKFVGVAGCLGPAVPKPPCVWVYADGTGQYMDGNGDVWPFVSAVITTSPTISSCASPHAGEFEATTATQSRETGHVTDGGAPLKVRGRFRACPEGIMVI